MHWDDFFRGLDKPMLLTMYGGDDVLRAMARIAELAEADSVDIQIPRAWQHADPFLGLSLPLAPDTFPAVRKHPVPAGLHCPERRDAGR